MTGPSGKKPFFHRLSGAAVLAIDWGCFGLDWQLGPLSMAVMSVAAFIATYAVVWRVQTRLGGDGAVTAHGKAFLGALAAAVPFPVAGTFVGGAILALSRPGRA